MRIGRTRIGTVGAVTLATVVAACDGAATVGPADDGTGPYATFAGRWARLHDPRDQPSTSVAAQRLLLDSHGRWTLERAPRSTDDTLAVRTVEYGRLVPEADVLVWQVDSVERVETPRRGASRRTVTRAPVFIEGHEFGGSRLRRAGDSLVIAGTTAWTGFPMGFEARFRRLP